MLLSDRKPNYVTVLSVSRAFGALNCEELIKMVHGLVTKMGFESEVAVLTSVLGFYWNHDMRVARKLFGEISSKDVVLWSAMVAACVKNEQYMEAVEYFREMQHNGVKPNHVSVVSILPACSYVSGGLSLGKGIHGFSIKRVFISFTNVQNSLVDMYAKCGNLEASIGVFNGIWKKDLISWRTVIHGCIVNEGAIKALSIFSLMQSCCFEPDESILRDTIMALLQAKETKVGQSFHCYIMKKGFLDFAFIGTALLHMYAKFGDVGTARDLFDQLNHKDLIAWSAMISVYAQGGQPYNALNTFKQMQLKNEKPNEFTFGGLLQACSSMEAQEFGESIHAHLIKAGYLSNTHLTSALIDLYYEGRWEDVEKLRKLVDENESRTAFVFRCSRGHRNMRGVLEVLLVNAEGIRHTNLLGTPTYYVIVQCGNQVHRSKVSSVKDDKVWWNEKFSFEYPVSDWKKSTHIKFRIMDLEFLTDGGFVGQTIFHLGGIITEGSDRGLIEVQPAPFNVVLEDDTYKGQIQIGFKFTVDEEVHMESREFAAQEDAPRQSICRSIFNLWKMSWFRRELFLSGPRQSPSSCSLQRSNSNLFLKES
ncbi:hypothetical protein Q3G72_029915 [Acer saccharum]|nr:hypothetical protein Q3G72_029915 [Acer saccharum]